MLFPRITYLAVTIDATLAARPLRQGLPRGVGAGIEVSAAGVPSAWVTRWERPLTVVQRITAAEWPTYRAWLEYAMQGGSFGWAKGPATAVHTCYLVSPSITDGGDLAELEYPGDHEFTYTIRRADGAAIAEVTF